MRPHTGVDQPSPQAWGWEISYPPTFSRARRMLWLGPSSRFAAFAAPLVTRWVEVSAKFESVLVTGHPEEEAEMSVLGGQVDGFIMTVIGPGLNKTRINRRREFQCLADVKN
ncbi:hypothetical protein N7465_000882 [Penicillium sp. CMV-2018d]|nr:hypothetical protein N7465_000882 [Penicillium sp. CMV-2018d]